MTHRLIAGPSPATSITTSTSTAACCGLATSSRSSRAAASRPAPARVASAGSSSAASPTYTTSAGFGSVTRRTQRCTPRCSRSPARSCAGADSAHREQVLSTAVRGAPIPGAVLLLPWPTPLSRTRTAARPSPNSPSEQLTHGCVGRLSRPCPRFDRSHHGALSKLVGVDALSKGLARHFGLPAPTGKPGQLVVQRTFGLIVRLFVAVCLGESRVTFVTSVARRRFTPRRRLRIFAGTRMRRARDSPRAPWGSLAPVK